jgi:hypothetical protein
LLKDEASIAFIMTILGFRIPDMREAHEEAMELAAVR